MGESSLTPQAARAALYEIIQQDAAFEAKAEEAMELGRRYLDADNGHLTRIDRATDHWEAIVSTDDADGRYPRGLELALETTYCRRTIETTGSIALADAPNEGWADDPAFDTHELHCYHGTPLVVDGEPWGTVCFVADDPRAAFTDGETMFAELIAKLLERELEREQHAAELTRQTNLSTVLNRVLRHNLRNDLSVIRGFTQLMADDLEGHPEADTALETIDELIALAEKARALDRVVTSDAEGDSTDVVALVEAIVADVADAYPAATIRVDAPDGDPPVASIQPSFERALAELIENAAKHGGDAPTVTVVVEAVPNAVEVRIADDGPGLASHEVDVLETGTETPLTHGTGLGLWLAHWIVTSHDGTIDATVTDAGTTMTITVPRSATTSAVHQQLSELTRARDQYEAAFEQATDAMVIIDDEARILHANPEASTIYGLDRQALLGQPIPRFLPDAFDFEAAWAAFHEAGRERDTVTIVGADGVERQVEYSATTDIVPGQHLIVARDITERLEREAELATRTQAMQEAPVGITLTDPAQEDNPIVYVNEAFSELTGYDRADVIGRNCRFLQGEDTDPDAVDRIREAIAAEAPVTETLLNYRQDGTPFWNEVSIEPITDDAGDVTRYVGFQQDVTDRVEREAALEETTQRLEAIVEASPDAIVALDADGTVQVWNEAAEDVFGYDAEAAIGESIRSLGLHSGDQRSEFERLFRRGLEGEALRNRVVDRRTRDGDRIQLSLSSAPLRDASGAVTGVLAVARPLPEHAEAASES